MGDDDPFTVDRLVASTVTLKGGKKLYVKSESEDLLRSVENLERIAINLAQSGEMVYQANASKRMETSDVGGELLRLLKSDSIDRILDVFPECRLNPCVRVMVDAITGADAGYHVRNMAAVSANGNMEKLANHLNKMVAGIREKMRSEETQRLIRNYRRCARQNRSSLVRMVDRMFRRYAKVLVVRLDLSYRKPSVDQLPGDVSSTDVRTHLRILLRDMRRKLFEETLISHVWKLEYGLVKGYHLHAFFFFDGAKVRKDIELANIIGRHWRDVVTEHLGDYFNCNAIQQKYPRSGIGMIEHRDHVKIDNLKNIALEYLLKTDYFVKNIVEKGLRTFGKGSLPKKKSTISGRPRRKVDQPTQPKREAV